MTLSCVSLECWRQSMAFPPFGFWQFDVSKPNDLRACDTIVRQHSWQSQNLPGRCELLAAIEAAEQKLRDELGFWPCVRQRDFSIPARVCKETPDGGVYVHLPEFHVHRLAREVETPLGDTPKLTYSDADGDGVRDKFSVSMALPAGVKTGSVIRVSVPDAYRTDAWCDCDDANRWAIRPVEIGIDETAGTLTVSGPLWLIGLPSLMEGVTKNALDPGNDAHLLPVLALTLVEETAADAVRIVYGDGSRASVSAEICNETTGLIRLNAGCGGVNCTGASCVQRIEISAVTGDARHDDWPQLIARLVAAELGSSVCACEQSNAELYKWQQDLALPDARGRFTVLSPDVIENPLGTRRGHLDVWRRVRSRRLVDGSNM